MRLSIVCLKTRKRFYPRTSQKKRKVVIKCPFCGKKALAIRNRKKVVAKAGRVKLTEVKTSFKDSRRHKHEWV